MNAVSGKHLEERRRYEQKTSNRVGKGREKSTCQDNRDPKHNHHPEEGNLGSNDM